MSNFYQYPPQQPPSSSGPYGGGHNQPAGYPYGQPAPGNPYYPSQSSQPPQQQGFPLKFPGQEILSSPDVIKMGLTAGQSMFREQQNRFMPGFSHFWFSLKYYFSVNNNYVLKKLLLVLYPLSNKEWKRISADEVDTGGSRVTHKWALPKQDINAPDLYLPLMSFITYVLLYGFLKGMTTPSSASFSPDILVQAVWRCLILQLLEAGGLKFGANILSIHVPFLDCYSFAGYKYIALCVNTITRFIHSTFSIVTAFYTSCMLGYFILKTVAIAIPPSPNENNSSGASPRLFIVLGFGVAELVLTLFISLF